MPPTPTALNDGGDDLLVPSDARVLEARKLISPVSEGRRQMRRSAMLSNESTSSDDSGYKSDDPLVEIPLRLDSAETLRVLGYDKKTASMLWTRWIEMDEDLRDEFLKFACRYIKYHEMDIGDDDDAGWNECLDGHGLNQELHSGIMDPKFKSLRLTATAKFWAIHFIEINYRTLKGIQDASIARATAASLEGSSSAAPNVNIQGSSSSPQQASGSGQPRVLLDYGTAAQIERGGSAILWKGLDLQRVRYVLDTGKVGLEDLVSSPPTDFCNSRAKPTLYFSPQSWVAEHYADYVRRAGHGNPETCLVRMIVPNNLSENISREVLEYGDKWKTFVWNCRRCVLTSNLPSEIADLATKALIIGPTCKTHLKSIVEKPWTNMSEKNLLRRDNNDMNSKLGIQWAFNGIEVLEKLQDVADIHVFRKLSPTA